MPCQPLNRITQRTLTTYLKRWTVLWFGTTLNDVFTRSVHFLSKSNASVDVAANSDEEQVNQSSSVKLKTTFLPVRYWSQRKWIEAHAGDSISAQPFLKVSLFKAVTWSVRYCRSPQHSWKLLRSSTRSKWIRAHRSSWKWRCSQFVIDRRESGSKLTLAMQSDQKNLGVWPAILHPAS